MPFPPSAYMAYRFTVLYLLYVGLHPCYLHIYMKFFGFTEGRETKINHCHFNTIWEWKRMCA